MFEERDYSSLKGKTHVEIKYKDQWKHESAIMEEKEIQVFLKDLDTHYHEGECHCFIKMGNHRVPRNQIEVVNMQDAESHARMLEWALKRRD